MDLGWADIGTGTKVRQGKVVIYKLLRYELRDLT
jgi:hypothetical protein